MATTKPVPSACHPPRDVTAALDRARHRFGERYSGAADTWVREISPGVWCAAAEILPRRNVHPTLGWTCPYVEVTSETRRGAVDALLETIG